MFDNLITPCILSPLTSSDQHMLSPFVYMLESISTGNELISLFCHIWLINGYMTSEQATSAVILVHTCTTCTSCSFYHTGLPHLTATFTLGRYAVGTPLHTGYPSQSSELDLGYPPPDQDHCAHPQPSRSRPLCTPCGAHPVHTLSQKNLRFER